MDIGSRDLQQCADAIIRLLAEFLHARGRTDQVAFNFTSGDRARLSEWFKGIRPVVKGNDVDWKLLKGESNGYESFREYLDAVFMYAGTYSLHKELERVDSLQQMKIGDIFIQPGFPGHACLVADMAVQTETGRMLYLLVESFTPAQDVVILRDARNPDLDPWYDLSAPGDIVTPDWTFQPSDLHRSSLYADQ